MNIVRTLQDTRPRISILRLAVGLLNKLLEEGSHIIGWGSMSEEAGQYARADP